MNAHSPATLRDSFGRQIASLRISITDKCNFRCIYCMPESGVPLKPHSALLHYEQIAAIVKEAATLGIFKIKITGGEPLVRKNIEVLIEQIAAVTGISDLGMTTNASLLTAEKARALKKAGLMRMNISLDTIDPERFFTITRGGTLSDVFHGIDNAIAAGFSPIKINMVIIDGTSETDIATMREFCTSKELQMQTIAHFSLDRRNEHLSHTTDRPPPCFKCNRLRLTADGFLKPCLFTDNEIRVDLNNIRESLLAAIALKPEAGDSCNNRFMSQIGG